MLEFPVCGLERYCFILINSFCQFLPESPCRPSYKRLKIHRVVPTSAFSYLNDQFALPRMMHLCGTKFERLSYGGEPCCSILHVGTWEVLSVRSFVSFPPSLYIMNFTPLTNSAMSGFLAVPYD